MSEIAKSYFTIEQHNDVLSETIEASKDIKLPNIPVSNMKENVKDDLLSNIRNASKKKCKIVISRSNANKFMEAVNERVVELRNKIVNKMDTIQKEITKFLTESENDARKDSHQLKRTYMENKNNLTKTNEDTIRNIKQDFLRDANDDINKLKTVTATFINVKDADEVDDLIGKVTDLTDKFKNNLTTMSLDFRKRTDSQQQRYKEIIEKMEKTYEEGLESIIIDANKKHDRMKEEKENARKQLEEFYNQKIKEEIDISNYEIKVRYWNDAGFFGDDGKYVEGKLVQALPSNSAVRVVVSMEGTYKTVEVQLDDLCIKD